MRELLELLEHDGRRSIKELATMLGRSEYEIEEQMKVGIVEFDLKNAVMINLPDDFNFIMGIDLFYFFLMKLSIILFCTC